MTFKPNKPKWEKCEKEEIVEPSKDTIQWIERRRAYLREHNLKLFEKMENNAPTS